MLLETKKVSRINPKRLSNRSLARYARRSDQVGMAARMELAKRAAKKGPKVGKTMKELEDALVAGRVINADAIKHIHAASRQKVMGAINRSNVRKQRNKDDRKLTRPLNKKIVGLEREVSDKDNRLKVSADAYSDLHAKHNTAVGAHNKALARMAIGDVRNQRAIEKKKETGELRGPSLWHKIKKAVR